MTDLKANESRPDGSLDGLETLPGVVSSVSAIRPAEYVDGCDSTTRRELFGASAIDPDVARERGYRTIGRPSTADYRPRQELEALSIPTWATREDRFFPGILVPIWGATGRVVTHQWKPKVPVASRDGKKMKYASAKGQSSRLDVHPRWTILSEGAIPPIRDVERPLFITEGIKKADSLTSRGYVTVGLNGVYNWRGSTGTLGDWEDVPLKGRKVGIVFDPDAAHNKMVRTAGYRLKKWLRSKGATDVRFFVPPAEFDGKPVGGVDDYFAAGATKGDFAALSSVAMPEGPVDETAFTDAKMAERYAEGALSGQYLYTKAFGWMAWNGKRWGRADDAEVLNVMREHAIGQHADALRWKAELIEQRKDPEAATFAEHGWAKAQSRSALGNALALALGLPELRKDANAFDGNPDLLNTPDGILDLASGHLLPHDPEQYMTRVTAVGYDPAATDPAFSTVLKSVSPDALDWLQIQFGQAITGHHSENLVMLTGVGRNGKSKLMDVLTTALGSSLPDNAGYARIVPNTLLLSTTDKSGPTPEKMTLLGLRFAYMEETPEDGHLNANTLKEVVDAPAITGRNLYKDQTTFDPTHSLFLNTNHPPQVGGTDTAIWRRLARVDFPYRFRLDGDGLGAALDIDRPGMTHMARALGTESARRAALAWMVEGARRWYELRGAEEVAPIPASVHDAVQKWRRETDDILAFFVENLVADPGAWVWSMALYEAFSDYVLAKGGKRGGMKLFTSRLVGHTGLPAVVSNPKKRRTDRGLAEYPFPPNGFVSDRARFLGPNRSQGGAFAGLRWRTEEDG